MRASLQRRSRRVREGFVSLWMLRSSFRIKWVFLHFLFRLK
jgi:hypothetical protein